jgi:DeoR/GlpR family transcriptional regulator of sugar metabolism
MKRVQAAQGLESQQLGLEDRRRRIRGLLEERSQISVAELAQRFAVSEVTIRGDLKALDGIGALVRVHGGALPRRESD